MSKDRLQMRHLMRPSGLRWQSLHLASKQKAGGYRAQSWRGGDAEEMPSKLKPSGADEEGTGALASGHLGGSVI